MPKALCSLYIEQTELVTLTTNKENARRDVSHIKNKNMVTIV